MADEGGGRTPTEAPSMDLKGHEVFAINPMSTALGVHSARGHGVVPRAAGLRHLDRVRRRVGRQRPRVRDAPRTRAGHGGRQLAGRPLPGLGSVRAEHAGQARRCPVGWDGWPAGCASVDHLPASPSHVSCPLLTLNRGWSGHRSIVHVTAAEMTMLVRGCERVSPKLLEQAGEVVVAPPLHDLAVQQPVDVNAAPAHVPAGCRDSGQRG